MSKNWSYGSIFKFRSQFVNGYVSRTEQERKHLKSTFMTPGYLDISFGFTYNCPVKKFPIVINLSPLSLNATFAESDWIRRRQVDKDGNEIKPAYSYGIEDPDKTSKYEGGSSIQIDFDRTFGKSNYLHYKTRISGFYGWMTDLGQKNKIRDYTEYRLAYEKWLSGGQNIKDKPRLPIHPTVRWGEHARNLRHEVYQDDAQLPALLQPGAESRRADQYATAGGSDLYLQEQSNSVAAAGRVMRCTEIRNIR